MRAARLAFLFTLWACPMVLAQPSAPPPAEAPPAARTFAVDVVALHEGRDEPGDPGRFADHWGYRYLFASDANRDAFVASPEAYEVQLGGACAKMGPLSGRGSTGLRTLYQGRLYTFASESCKQSFLADPESRADRADAKPAATPESLARGKELLGLMVLAMGGDAAVDSMSSLRMEATSRDKQGAKEYAHRRTWIAGFPDKFRRDDDWDEFTYAMIVTPDVGVMAYSKVEEMHPQQRLALRRQLYHLPAVAARLRGRDDFVAVAGGPVTVGERSGERLHTWFDGILTTFTLDPASGRVLAATFRDRGKGGAIGTVEVRYAEHRAVDALTLPTRGEAWFNGERWAGGDESPQTIAINDAAAALFERPARKQ